MKKFDSNSFYRKNGYSDLTCERFGRFSGFWSHVIWNTMTDRQGRFLLYFTKKIVKYNKKRKILMYKFPLLLWLSFQKSSLFPESIWRTFYRNNGRMMQQSIQNRICQGRRTQNFSPLWKRCICCNDCAVFFISSGNQLEKKICSIKVYRHVSYFIDNQNLIATEKLHSCFQTVFQKGSF